MPLTKLRFIAKLFSVAACAIIMLHSVLPHHHHDSGSLTGFVYENEIGCHCHHEHGTPPHHHDGCCKLQYLLSQLVISTKDDKVLCPTDQANTSSISFDAILSGQYSFNPLPSVKVLFKPLTLTPIKDRCIDPHLLRGPPIC